MIFFKSINCNGKSLFFLDEVFNPFGQLAAVINEMIEFLFYLIIYTEIDHLWGPRR